MRWTSTRCWRLRRPLGSSISSSSSTEDLAVDSKILVPFKEALDPTELNDTAWVIPPKTVAAMIASCGAVVRGTLGPTRVSPPLVNPPPCP